MATWADVLLARGIMAIRTKKEGMEAFRRWGLAVSDCRPGSDTIALFKFKHPDCATVYVDGQGRIRAVDLRRSVFTP